MNIRTNNKNYKIVGSNLNYGTTVAGATDQISSTILIPKNTIPSRCSLTIYNSFERISISGTVIGTIYVNTVNSLSGATLLMTRTSIASWACCVRNCSIYDGNIYIYPPTRNGANFDYTFDNSFPPGSVPIDTKVDNYILFCLSTGIVSRFARNRWAYITANF